MARFQSLCRIGAAAVLAVTLAGCGGTPAPTGPPPERQALAKAEMKQRLEMIAKDGQTGSTLGGIKEGLEQIGDPTLLSDYAKLESAKSPAEIKKIAGQMAAKL